VSQELKGSWALILGASSGFGAATARSLARRGMNIFGVHLDRKPAMPQVEALIEELRGLDAQVRFFNVNAADDENRRLVLDEMAEDMGEGPKVRVFLHSLAFGALKPYIAEAGQGLTRAQMVMTLDVMSHSLVYWVQDLVQRGYLEQNSRVFAMTSSGGHIAWKSYGAVSAAKASLESHIRQLALDDPDGPGPQPHGSAHSPRGRGRGHRLLQRARLPLDDRLHLAGGRRGRRFGVKENS